MLVRPPFRALTAAALAAAALPAAWALAAPAPAQPAAAAAPAPAQVRVTECRRGPAPADRRVEFRGQMSRVPDTARMWMRFTLQERAPGSDFETVRAPGLGVWRKSRRGVAGFAHRQRVVELAQGSRYRTIVSFRWYGADGSRLRSARRRSAECRQGPVPNLRVTSIDGKRVNGSPGTVRYVIRVTNAGRAPASGVAVALAVDGATIDTPVVGDLAPGRTRRAVVNGPACRSSVEATADPSGTVRESSEADNILTVACPPAL